MNFIYSEMEKCFHSDVCKKTYREGEIFTLFLLQVT